jgi:hypothetical protein
MHCHFISGWMLEFPWITLSNCIKIHSSSSNFATVFPSVALKLTCHSSVCFYCNCLLLSYFCATDAFFQRRMN